MATANPTQVGLREPGLQHHQPDIEDDAEEYSVTITQRPPNRSLDTVVVYVDGSYFKEHNIAVSGIVVRGTDGTTYRELWATHPDSNTSVETESAAVLKGIEIAQNYDPSHIVMYSDCKPVVERVNKESRPDLDIFDKIYRLLEETEFVNVHHIPRKRNERADQIAHRGLRHEKDRARQAAD